MFEKIKERYQKYYITDAQLERYVELSVISREQADEIKELEKITGGGAPNLNIRITLPAGGEVTICER